MKFYDLIKIAEVINEEVQKFIPYSSNIPYLTNQPFNSCLWLSIKRSPNDAQGVRKRLRDNLVLDLDDLDVSPPLKRRRLYDIRLPGKNYPPTLQQVSTFFYQLSCNKINHKYHKDGERYTFFHRMESDAKNSMKFGIGNCSEKANLALMLLVEYPKRGVPGLAMIDDNKITLELMTLGDHVFVVVNRNNTGVLNDSSTWGDRTIILDPWMNEVLPFTNNKLLATSNWYRYVSNHTEEISRHPNEYAYISEGHSARWIKHREKYDEPTNLWDWESAYQTR